MTNRVPQSLKCLHAFCSTLDPRQDRECFRFYAAKGNLSSRCQWFCLTQAEVHSSLSCSNWTLQATTCSSLLVLGVSECASSGLGSRLHENAGRPRRSRGTRQPPDSEARRHREPRAEGCSAPPHRSLHQRLPVIGLKQTEFVGL